MTTVEIMTPQGVRDLQVIVPEWMEKILSEADRNSKQVEVTRLHAQFGTYTIAIKVVEQS